MIHNVPEYEPQIHQTESCSWKLNVFDYIIVCWSLGLLWGFIGKFTSTNIGGRAQRDGEVVIAVARPVT